MATVTVNVQANTGEATKDINNLDQALDGADKAAAGLSSSLEQQEARIKTLGGAINIVGGSVELLAGSLALTGALSKEQAEQFQTAAVGAIAFADGSKRVFEGYKELNEGLAAYGGVAGKARSLTLALNKAILANPYIAAAVALTALVSGIIIFTRTSRDEENQNDETTESLNERTAAVKATETAYANAEEKLRALGINAEASNQSIQDSIDLEEARIRASIAGRKNEINVIEVGRTAATRRGEEALEQFEAQVALAKARLERDKNALKLLLDAEKLFTTGLGEEQAQRILDQAEANKTLADARKKEAEDAFDFYITMLGLGSDFARDAREQFIADLDKQNEETFAATTKSMEDRMKASVNMITTTGKEAGDSTAKVASDTLFANAELAENVVGDSLAAFGSLFSSLAEVTGDGNEEAFEKGKKFKIAEVVTSSIQAAFQAFGAAQQFGPILGPILGAAQVAAIAVASNKAIGDIRSSTFSSPTSPNLSSIGSGGAPGATAGFGAGLGGGSQTLVTNIPNPEPGPMRAYVVTGDVTNGIEAQSQLERRRTFGPG